MYVEIKLNYWPESEKAAASSACTLVYTSIRGITHITQMLKIEAIHVPAISVPTLKHLFAWTGNVEMLKHTQKKQNKAKA